MFHQELNQEGNIILKNHKHSSPIRDIWLGSSIYTKAANTTGVGLCESILDMEIYLIDLYPQFWRQKHTVNKDR